MDLAPDEMVFAAPMLRRMNESTTWHYLPVPDTIAEVLEAKGIRRLIVTINGRTYNRAMRSTRHGERFITASRTLMREVGADVGETVIVQIEPDPNPEEPEIPDELELALADDAEAAERFYGMTAGKRRGLAHYVDSAKRPETRIKRALELVEKLRKHTLWGDRDGQ